MPRQTLLALSLILAGCGAPTQPPEGTLRVLFLGNSLTYVNDLPGMVAEIAAAAGGDVTIEVRDESQANFAIEDHWNRGASMSALGDGPWHVVVMQQGPSSLPENQAYLREWTVRMADRIRDRGARPGLYMVWPDDSRPQAFDAVSTAYREAAVAADAALYPAGEAWRAAWRADPTLALYGPDGFHPSELGTYLAALTIFHGVTGQSVVGLSTTHASPEVAELLQRAAEEAVGIFGR
jgi:hypothetical protein